MPKNKPQEDAELIPDQLPFESEYFVQFDGQNKFKGRVYSNIVRAKDAATARRVATADAKVVFGCEASDLWMSNIAKL